MLPFKPQGLQNPSLPFPSLPFYLKKGHKQEIIKRETMAMLAEKAVLSATSVFQTGRFKVAPPITVPTSDPSAPPKPLLIFAPSEAGEYPVLLFFHGCSIETCFYTQLFTYMSSHGYILVAPQLHGLIPPSGPTDIKFAAEVANWLPQYLHAKLPPNVYPNFVKVALLGHSRGGKTAFTLLLDTPTSLTFKALIGIDPVAGPSKGCQINPKILTNTPQSLEYGIPVMVIGTGLGDQKKNCCFPACAPDGVNHKEFYYECKPPCYYFVTSDFGHNDILDDNPKGLMGFMMSKCICKNGESCRDPMRRCVGGLVVAFVKACFDDEKVDFKAIMEEPSIAPTKLCSYQRDFW